MKKLNLATQVLIAFVIGTVLGIIFQKDILFLQPVGDIFLRLIQMIVVPLIFFSIIGGIANIGDIRKLRRIGSKVMGFYVITTILSTIIGLAVANILQPGKGFSADQIVATGEPIKEADPMTVGGTILSMIPSNPMHALSEGNIMQVIVFAAFLGIVMTILGNKVSTVKKFVEEGTLIMFKLTDLVMKVTPLGVLAIMLLNTMGLPTAIMGMIVGIFRPIDMIHTALNVTGDVVSTLAVARMENMFHEESEDTAPQLIAEPAFEHEKI